jgi:hypothetical protein
MTFEQWWSETHFPAEINREAYRASYEACWDSAIENALVEARQIRKAFIDHYGAPPQFLDKFVQDRIVAICRVVSNNS